MNPFAVLGIGSEATEDEIRAAYLTGIKQNPPETAPEQFERIRDAYEQLRDPRKRARQSLLVDPDAPLVSLIDNEPDDRRFAGPELWQAALKAQPKR
jgi:DnaJ domain